MGKENFRDAEHHTVRGLRLDPTDNGLRNLLAMIRKQSGNLDNPRP